MAPNKSRKPTGPLKTVSKEEATGTAPEAVKEAPEEKVYRFVKVRYPAQRIILKDFHEKEIKFKIPRAPDKTYATQGTFDTTDKEVAEALWKYVEHRYEQYHVIKA